MKKIGLLYFLCLLSFIACNPDDNQSPISPIDSLFENGFFVLNEGGYTNNNASLDFYNYDADSLIRNIYFAQNAALMGDILQSVSKIDSSYYFVINNSGKILVTDTQIKNVESIEGLTSPRYIANYQEKIFISDLYADQIHVANKNSGTLIGSINTSTWSEGIISQDSFIIACLPYTNEILLIDAKTNTKLDTLVIPGSPSSILSTDDHSIWVLGSGNISGSENATLNKLKIQGNSLQLIFSGSIDPGVGLYPKLCKDENNQSLYLAIGQSIYKQNMTEDDLNLTYLFETEAITIYGINYNPIYNEILVSDAIDYVQQGIIFRYDIDGNKLGDYQAGVIPSNFLIIP